MAKGSNNSVKKRRADKDGAYFRPDRRAWYFSFVDSDGIRKRRRAEGALNHKQALDARNHELSRVAVEKRTGIKQEKPSDGDFEQACLNFLEGRKSKVSHKSYERMEAICRLHLIPYFRGRISSIDHKKVDRYLTKRLSAKSKVHSEKPISQETVLKELSILKQILKGCVKERLIPFNPTREIEFKAEKVERVRYLQPEELSQLLEASQDWLKPIILVAVLTGMRRGEILSMRWADVDIQNRRIILPANITKTKKLRVVYLNDKALHLLSSLKSQAQTLALEQEEKLKPTAKIFPGVIDNCLSRAFKRTCDLAEIEDFRFHDLRHTAATWMRMSGSSIDVVAALLGHSDLRMAQRYQHLSPEFLLNAVSGLDRVFQNIGDSYLESGPPESFPVEESAPGMVN